MIELLNLNISKRAAVWANIVLWLYGIFFTATIADLVPGIETHFGGGLGDLLFLFIMVGVLIITPIVLFLYAVFGAKASAYVRWFLICFFIVAGLHLSAARGNRKGYQSAGNFHGLYYDRSKI